jgi:predicted NBD/HSP70 family sugar kinase
MANQTLVKYVNELSILTQLRTQGPTSRAELARRLSLTPPSITRLVSNLQCAELIRDAPMNPKQRSRVPGRPAERVEINASAAYFLGVEIGVGIIRFALIDLATQCVHRTELTVAKNLSPEHAVDLIARHLLTLQANSAYAERIRSVAVTVPGLVRTDGFIVYLPILGWRNLNLNDALIKATGLHCSVENNADASAFGAVYTQPNLPTDCTIYLKLGTGCGGAAIINGRLLRGAAGTACEVGHLPLTLNGRKCSCGQIGCLETWVNTAAVAEDYYGNTNCSEAELYALPQTVVDAARQQSPLALNALTKFQTYLARGIVGLVNIFNPSTIIMGGLMLPLVEHCLPAIRAHVGQAIVPGTLVPDFRLSQLGLYDCAVGAATVAHHEAFDLSNIEISGLISPLTNA